MTYDISTLVLLVFLFISAVVDLYRNRIPNVLSIGCLVVALSMQGVFVGWDGVSGGASGAAVGLACLLPFYLLGGMGAGDVKLMAGVGGFLGVKAVILAISVSLALAAIYALLLVTYRGEWLSFIQRYSVALKTKTYVLPEKDSIAGHRFPFAIAIFCGVTVVLGWGSQLEFYYLGNLLSYQLKAWGVML